MRSHRYSRCHGSAPISPASIASRTGASGPAAVVTAGLPGSRRPWWRRTPGDHRHAQLDADAAGGEHVWIAPDSYVLLAGPLRRGGRRARIRGGAVPRPLGCSAPVPVRVRTRVVQDQPGWMARPASRAPRSAMTWLERGHSLRPPSSNEATKSPAAKSGAAADGGRHLDRHVSRQSMITESASNGRRPGRPGSRVTVASRSTTAPPGADRRRLPPGRRPLTGRLGEHRGHLHRRALRPLPGRGQPLVDPPLHAASRLRRRVRVALVVEERRAGRLQLGRQPLATSSAAASRSASRCGRVPQIEHVRRAPAGRS